MKYKDYIFDFEKLDVYKMALEFTNEIFSITLTFRREVQYSLGEQFRRAALSICNNIAEGSRKIGKAKGQFYGFALDSARECVPMISLAVMQKQIDKEKEEYLRDKCIQICNMLYKLSCSVKTSNFKLNT